MQSFTDNRTPETTDEMWLVEHDPVFTQGQAGKDEHVLMPGDIPVVKVDRGGQVTYHGPGQQVLYVLLDIKRAKLGVRQLVNALERSVVNIMAEYDVEAYPRSDAPGVYVDGSKLCSVGLRIRKGCSFHGLAMNVNMDLGPFQRINPCGYAGMEMVNASDLGGPATVAEAGKGLVHYLVKELNIDTVINKEGFDE
ncbi:lipoyl(octanoyl) transferase LipB [Alteromonas sediminis]